MVNPIPESVKKIWDDWNIQGMILFSLLLQTLLILLAPLRKATRYQFIIFVIWSAYLLADWAANFGVGLIAERATNSQTPEENNELFVFWAPFLLLHLGGPDTITAFALEDNELWLRQLFGLVFQAGFTFYIFLLSLPGNKLYLPLILILIAAIIKCIERTRALYLASGEKFRDSTLLQLAEAVVIETEAEIVPEVMACQYFKIFKGIVVDLFSSFKDFPFEGPSFGDLSPEEALRIIEVELNLVYEVLHTKIQVTHSVPGIILRFICFGSVVAAFSFFYFQMEKYGFNEFDIGVTYTLFLGAVALDIISFFRFVFSDWTFVAVRNDHYNSIAAIVRSFLNLKSVRWQKSDSAVSVFAAPFLFRRWSGSVSGLSVINSHSSKRYGIIRFLQIDKIIACFGQAEIASEIRIKSSLSLEPLTKELWVFIFEEMKRKAEYVDEIRRRIDSAYEQEARTDPETGIIIPNNPPHNPEEDIRKGLLRKFTAKGDCTLHELDTKGMLRSCNIINFITGMPEKYDECRQFSFDKSLIIWHIATELLYNGEVTDDQIHNAREFSKILSNYMLYLLVLKPIMVNSKDNVKLEPLRAYAKICFGSKPITPEKRGQLNLSGYAYELDDANTLAEELQNLEKHIRWELVSKVWVELLSYAACCNTSPRAHVQQVSNGGELITFVWVLMAHFGLVAPKSED